MGSLLSLSMATADITNLSPCCSMGYKECPLEVIRILVDVTWGVSCWVIQHWYCLSIDTYHIIELHTCELEFLALGSEPQSEILSYQWQIFIYLIVTSRWINHKLPANHIGTTQFSWYSPAAARGAHQWHFSCVIQQTKITTWSIHCQTTLLDDVMRSPTTMGTVLLLTFESSALAVMIHHNYPTILVR